MVESGDASAIVLFSGGQGSTTCPACELRARGYRAFAAGGTDLTVRPAG